MQTVAIPILDEQVAAADVLVAAATAVPPNAPTVATDERKIVHHNRLASAQESCHG